MAEVHALLLPGLPTQNKILFDDSVWQEGGKLNYRVVLLVALPVKLNQILYPGHLTLTCFPLGTVTIDLHGG